jgi:hypothetical protein
MSNYRVTVEGPDGAKTTKMVPEENVEEYISALSHPYAKAAKLAAIMIQTHSSNYDFTSVGPTTGGVTFIKEQKVEPKPGS